MKATAQQRERYEISIRQSLSRVDALANDGGLPKFDLASMRHAVRICFSVMAQIDNLKLHEVVDINLLD